MIRWEYDEAFYAVEELWTQHLDEAGAEGWELVVILPDEDGFFRCVFKRPLEDSDGAADG